MATRSSITCVTGVAAPGPGGAGGERQVCRGGHGGGPDLEGPAPIGERRPEALLHPVRGRADPGPFRRVEPAHAPQQLREPAVAPAEEPDPHFLERVRGPGGLDGAEPLRLEPAELRDQRAAAIRHPIVRQGRRYVSVSRACSASRANASGSFTAISASALRSSSIPDRRSPKMKRE